MANNLLSIIDGKIQIKNDAYGRVNTFTPFICRADKKIICSLTGVTKFDISLKLTDISEIDFTVSKYITNSSTFEQELNPAYKYLNSFYGILIPELGQYGYFRINEEPTIKAENTRYEMKSFTAYSGESVMQYEHLTGFFVNQGTTQSLEMFTENLTPTGLPEKKIQLYNPDDSKLSLLDLILSDDYYGWTIGHVDRSIQTLMRAFSISNSQNVYSFLTKDVAQAFRCIFDFDTIHNVINVYSIDDYGKNTNIYLSFERFVQEIKVKQSNDEIYTVFNVRGDNDLDISYVNFGSNKIANVDYPLYMMDKEIYNTYKLYESYRDSLRQSYKDLMIDYSHQQQLLSALMDRQPQDSINNNWSSTVYYSLDDLQTDLAMFKAAAELIEQIYTDESGVIDYEELNKSADAALYYSYKSVNIPDIENEIKYRSGEIGKREDKVNSDIVWEMYGLNDLILKRETYLELINTLAESGYTEPWDNTKTISRETWDAHYQEWQDYQVYVEELDELIDKKTEQVNDIKEKIDDDLSQLKDVAEKSSLEYYYNTFSENFSDDAVNYPQIIKSLYKESDYVDSNYLITSTDDTLAIIAESEELYQAAKKRLDIESRPQLVWSVDTDSLYATKDFEPLRDYLQLGDFINLIFDTERFAHQYNDSNINMELEGSFDVEDDTIGRNILLNTKNTRTSAAATNNSAYTSYYYATDFGENYFDEEGCVLTITADYEVIGEVTDNSHLYVQLNGTAIVPIEGQRVQQYVANNKIGVYERTFKLTANQLSSEYTRLRFRLYGNGTLDGAKVKISNVKLEIGNKATAYSPAPEDGDLVVNIAENINIENNTFIGENYRFRVSEIEFNALDYTDFSITFADIIKSRAGSSDVESILDSYISSRSNQIRIDASNNASAVASEVAASLIKPYLQVTNAAIENAQITNAQVEDLEAINANIETLLADYIKANELSAEIANIDTLSADDAFIRNLETMIISADKATIFDLLAGNITADKSITLVSKEGSGSIILENATMKYLDADGNVRMAVGYDDDDRYDIKIWGAEKHDGTQDLLWDTTTGIQSGAIADNLIGTSMLSNNAVTSDKINWNGISDSTDENGKPIFNSGQVTLNGESLTTQWSSLQDEVADISITASSQVFTSTDGSDIYSPTYITLTPNAKLISPTRLLWYYKTDSDANWTQITDIMSIGSHCYIDDNKQLIVLNDFSAFANSRSVVFKCAANNTTTGEEQYSDTITIMKISNGVDGETTINVIMSNEAQTIATDEYNYPFENYQFSTNIDVFMGTAKLTPVSSSSTLTSGTFKISNVTCLDSGITVDFSSTAGVVSYSVNKNNPIANNGYLRVSIEVYGLSDTVFKTIGYSSSLSGKDGTDATLLRIDSSRGTVFKNNAVNTVLSVIIYKGSERIENSTQLASVFGTKARLQWEWLRLDDDTYGIISASDTRLSDKGFHLTLSPEDVDVKVTFRCNLIEE